MKTVSSICASGSVTALSAVGLLLVRPEHDHHHDHHDHHHRDPSNRLSLPPAASHRASIPELDMTAVASFPSYTKSFDASFAPLATRSSRIASEGDHGRPGTRNNINGSSSRKAAQKRHSSLTPSAVPSVAMDRYSRPQTDGAEQSNILNARPTAWLRRLSSSVSTSRESSRTPSRPSSAVYTTANGFVAVSHAGSATPIVSDSSPPALPPNKLVKRPSSLDSVDGFSSSGPRSRLPIPAFRRPATSHQRSAALHEQLQNRRKSLDSANRCARDTPWRPYFTPRIPAEQHPSSRRRSSTGIPNPIKRVYPDRKYTPTLVSAREIVQPATVEIDIMDDESSDQERSVAAVEHPVAASSASSPFLAPTTHFEESAAPRRSFSIGDLLSTGPQPLWRRPSSSRGKPSRFSRKVRSRGLSEPQTTMGNNSSTTNGYTGDRPAKRRDLTDLQDSQRSVYSSSSSSYVAPHPDARQEVELSLGPESPFLQFTPDHALFVEEDPSLTTRTPPLGEQHRLPSATFSSSSARPLRLSAAQSEITSTIGSDSEYRSVGDNSTDYQSDTQYDSIQTRTTRSSSGRRGPHIETIFDESPPAFSSGRSTKLRDFLSDGPVSDDDHNIRYRHSTIEEEDSVTSTPVRSIRKKSLISTPGKPSDAQLFASSPPAILMPDPEEIDWDVTDDETSNQGLGIRRLSSSPTNGTQVQPIAPFRFGPSLRPGNSRSANSTPLRNGASPMDKTNLFDWSEHQPSPSHLNNSPPRPRTVHGKKDQDSRGSRPIGRRPTSGMHARSHSVPVVPDLSGKRNNVVANKFGTWGVGSKGVTEDWNEDFDFDEPSLPVQGLTDQDEKRIDSGHEMLVPRSIREQQENVVANIGLLREWGLLIEELKELRIRAVAVDMLRGSYAQAWREVDAMIELADQETEEQTLEPRRSPPSSPGFDYSLFEDTPNRNDGGRPRQPSGKVVEQPTPMAASPTANRTTTPQSARVTTRPRKDSELVAQSVIAALQSKRVVSETEPFQFVGNKKVPFDTATLRHIVPYVNGLKRKVKDGLRETEGLYSSPRRSSPSTRRETEPEEPAFRHIFKNPPSSSLPFRQRSRRQQAATDNNEAAQDST